MERITFTKTQLRSIARDYKTSSMGEIAKSWGLSPSIIRRALIEAGVEIQLGRRRATTTSTRSRKSGSGKARGRGRAKASAR